MGAKIGGYGQTVSEGIYVRACFDGPCRQAGCADLKPADIEVLACMAARLAGVDPDRPTTVRLGEVVAFDDVAWRYPDFLARAEAAYRILTSAEHPNWSRPERQPEPAEIPAAK